MTTREHHTEALKTFFRERVTAFRREGTDGKKMTQAQMARILAMDERSYVDLEHGVSGCSALTLALFLIYCCGDPVEFLEKLKEVLESDSDRAA